MNGKPPESDQIEAWVGGMADDEPPVDARTSGGPRPVSRIMGMSPYKIPKPQKSVNLRLDGNEGLAPPKSLQEALSVQSTDVLRRYPQPWLFEERLAKRLAVPPGRVMVTAGGDEALDRICRTFLEPGRSLILPVPTFEMLNHYARLAGANVETVSWLKDGYPTEEVIRCIGPETGAIAVVSPNNPTGLVASSEDLLQVAEAAPDALIIVDLAYGEFADADLIAAALDLPNAVVVRSLSKAWGLAGLRVGFAVGPEKLIGYMRTAGGPYAVSRPSLALAGAWLEEGGHRMSIFVSRIKQERRQLSDALKRLGGTPFPSQANFLLCRFDVPELIYNGLAGLGIAVRNFIGTPGIEDCLRITCPGQPGLMTRLLSALEMIGNPQGLLLDMDGVLADVSDSYHKAIQQTAVSYNVELSLAEIQNAKNESGSNNDWEVTQRLLSNHGVTASLSEVTRRFESFYQGAPDRPGLWKSERLLPDVELLRRLAKRMPLAVVTGRPRADARRFLGRMGIDVLISALVVMEDAPPKPDPAPLVLALQRLGIQRAWMVGDTPDDIAAALAAGVMPLGVIPPGEESGIARTAMMDAGAAYVAEALADIEALLLKASGC